MNRPDDRRPAYDPRDPRRGYAPPPPRKRGYVGKVIWVVAAVALAAFLLSRFVGVSATSEVKVLPPKKPLASLKAKELQQQVAEHGIAEGAKAGRDAVNASADFTVTPPDPEVEVSDSDIVVRRVRSTNPHVLPRDKAEAEKEALAEARRILLERKLLPPKSNGGEWQLVVDRREEVAPPDEVKKAWAKEGLDEHRGWVEVDVKVSHDTLRKERAKGRTAEAGFWFGTAFLVLLAGYGFLRLDMWTKGYLSLLLGVLVAGAAVGGVVLLGWLVF